MIESQYSMLDMCDAAQSSIITARAEPHEVKPGDVWALGRHRLMCGWAIGKAKKRAELIVDVFGGSGTTLIACEQMGRTCYTMEIDPHYCGVIIDRWQRQTGQNARLVERMGGRET